MIAQTVQRVAGRGASKAGILLAAVLAAAATAANAEPEQLVKYNLKDKQRAYDLLIPPDVKPDEPLPLVVYLHPTGKPNFDEVRRDYWPIFRKFRCLMLLPTSRGKRMWLAGEQGYIGECIADVVKRRRTVDATRIVLMGVSGGGQVALLLADQAGEMFRAVIVISTNPVVARGSRAEWFYPNAKVLGKCPYFVINPLSQGSSLMYWRQVRDKLEPTGARIYVRPVAGQTEHYVKPPAEFEGWLKQVMAGQHPPRLDDLQQLAVAEVLSPVTSALPAALKAARPVKVAQRMKKTGPPYDLAVPLPDDYQRSVREDRADSTGSPMTQVRFEHKKWRVYARVEASVTAKPMAAETRTRGLLYQVYHKLTVPAGGRFWSVKIGSITFPDRRKDTTGKVRGWISTLFLRAVAPIQKAPTRWLTILIMDETGKPDAKEMATLFQSVAAGLTVGESAKPAAPKEKAR